MNGRKVWFKVQGYLRVEGQMYGTIVLHTPQHKAIFITRILNKKYGMIPFFKLKKEFGLKRGKGYFKT